MNKPYSSWKYLQILQYSLQPPSCKTRCLSLHRFSSVWFSLWMLGKETIVLCMCYQTLFNKGLASPANKHVTSVIPERHQIVAIIHFATRSCDITDIVLMILGCLNLRQFTILPFGWGRGNLGTRLLESMMEDAIVTCV